MKLEGAASRAVDPSGEDELAGKVNYFLGNDPAKWRTNLPTYGRVRLASVYPGVDLVYYGKRGRLEYDFVVAPNANTAQIRLRFSGAGVRLNAGGDLVLSTGNGTLIFNKPRIYQSIEGNPAPVPGSFVLSPDKSVRFEIGRYDHSHPLIIDPVLSYATYLGGTKWDSIQGIAVSKSGEAYVTGYTASIDFPVTAGALQTAHLKNSVNETAFVARLNQWGTALVYATYLGGSGIGSGTGDAAFGIAIDSTGDALVAGSTYSSDFPVTAGAVQTKYQGAKNKTSNAFVTKLNATGSALIYSTYLGGTGAAFIEGMGAAGDAAAAIAVDSQGNAYVAGSTGSTNFPVTKGVVQSTKAGGANDKTNAFAAKINATGTALLYATYLGGTETDAASALAIDGQGGLFLAGRTASSDFPVTSGAYQKTNKAGVGGSGVGNAFVLKLNSTATALKYSTYLGGTFGDMANGIAIDATGAAYVTGQAASLNFPVTAGAFQQANKGSSKGNAFVTKLNAAGSALVYSSYLGGNRGDEGNAIAVDGLGDAFVTGNTASFNFPVTSNALQMKIKTTPPDITGFVTEMNPAGTAEIYSSYLGGSQWDDPNALALGVGAVYLAGLTQSNDFPVTEGAFESAFVSGGYTGFVAKIGLGTAPAGVATVTTLTSSANPQTNGDAVTYMATVTPVTGSTTPTGVVTFSVDENTVSEMGLDGTGRASFTAHSLALGNHYIQAAYGGATGYTPSGNGLTQTISLPVAAAPDFDPPAGTYASAQSVTITDATPGAAIYYTTNGAAPTANSTQYSTPIPVGVGTTIKAIAIEEGYQNSPESSAFYRITPATTTTLAITSGGTSVASVTGKSVVTLTASVKMAGAAVTKGQVKFCDSLAKYCTDVHLLGTSQLTAAGTATTRITPSVGSHNYIAVFPGTNSAAGSVSGAAPLTVTAAGKLPTLTSLAPSGSPGNYTLSATVTGLVNPAGTAAPAGMVSFIDGSNGNAVLASAALGSGIAGMNWAASHVSTPGPAASIAIADFNGDGFADMAAITAPASVTILLGKGNGAFTALAQKPATGTNPSAIVAADFNSDGKLDLAVLNVGDGNSNGTVTILLGNGDGTFTSGTQSPATGPEPGALVAADFNGDGIPDLAITDYAANDTAGNLTVLLGNGNGTFTAAGPSPEIGGASFGLTAADFNGDGIADLAFIVPHDGSGLIQVMLGDGDGTFGAPIAISTDIDPGSIAVGDFNGDGKLDMAVTTNPGLEILRGNGDGSFTTESVGGPQGNALALGDFDGNGKADLALINGGNLAVLLGNGDGSFTANATSAATGQSPNGAVAADLNGDGLPDIAIANGSQNTITVLLAELTETATAAASGVNLTGPLAHLVAASYPGDIDYAASASGAVALPPPAAAPIFSLAPGTYYSAQSVTLSSATPGTTIYYTINGAKPTTSSLVYGAPIAVSTSKTVQAIAAGANYSESPIASAAYVIRAPAATATTLAITSGTSTAPIKTVVQGAAVTLTATVKSGGLALAPGLVKFCDAAAKSCTDVHLLGSAQLSTKGTAAMKFLPGPGSHSYKAIYVGENSHLASISLAQPLAVTLKTQTKIATVTALTTSGTVGNYKLTGTVVGKGGTASLAGSLTFFDATTNNSVLGNAALGPGTRSIGFLKAAGAPVGANPVQVAVADFNGDGIPDMAVTNYAGYSVSVLLGKGDGSFKAAASPSTIGTPFAIEVADFNGDGRPDLAISTGGNNNNYASLQVLLGKGDGTFKALAARALGGPFVIGDFNRDGIPDLAYVNEGNNAITVLPGKGDGTFLATAINTTFNSPFYIAAGDFNGDGKLDLAVLGAAAGKSVTILLGKGDGTFAAASTHAPTGSGPNAIAMADFNGDGKLDMAVVNSIVGTVSVLLGHGDGTFAAVAPALAGGNEIDGIQVGDVIGDGIADLVISSFNSKRVSVYLGKGNGTFATAIDLTPTADPQSLAVADFNGDGFGDLGIVVFTGAMNVLLAQPIQSASASVLKIAPKGAGTHQVKVTYSGNGSYLTSTSAAKPVTGTAAAKVAGAAAARGSTSANSLAGPDSSAGGVSVKTGAR